MALPIASQSEVLRTVQKDQYFISHLTAIVTNALRSFGARHFNYIPFISSTLYGSFTTLKDLQTLGEQYAGLIQVDDTYCHIPSKFIQVICVLLEAGGETLVNATLARLIKKVQTNDQITERAKLDFVNALTLIKELVPVVEQLHSAAFYLRGGQLSVPKSVFGVNYVRSRPSAPYQYNGLQILPIVFALRAVLTAWQIVSKRRQEYQSQQANVPSSLLRGHWERETTHSCSSCLDRIGNVGDSVEVLLLPCGHLCCADCAYQPACAICRSTVDPRSIIYLQNIA